MNLTTDPWIPVVFQGGESKNVSLAEAFEGGHEIRDLRLRPHEYIAVMRVLVCIAQAGLDGPNDRAEWQLCREKIPRCAIEYLERRRGAFELFGDGQRFLQLSDLRPARPGKQDDPEEFAATQMSKLDMALASGNTPTLFDQGGGRDRQFTPAECALMLLTFQNFSPCGRIGVALWKGVPTPMNGSSNHAPCSAGSSLFTLLRGAQLLDSIHKNLLTKDLICRTLGEHRWGRPIWEMVPASAADATAVHNATESYLGRMVPLSRAIRLSEDGMSLLLANGLDYPNFQDGWREPWATVVVRQKNEGRALLPASLDRAVWRELSALTVIDAEIGGPLTLTNVASLTSSVDIWVGGFVVDKAKPLGTVESVFNLPEEMFHSTAQNIYQAGVRYAESVEWRIKRAVAAFHKDMKDNVDRGDMKERRRLLQQKSCAQFWTDVEQRVPELISIAVKPATLGFEGKWRRTGWGKSVWRSALSALDRCCPRNTARQIRAYAVAMRTFYQRSEPNNRLAKETAA